MKQLFFKLFALSFLCTVSCQNQENRKDKLIAQNNTENEQVKRIENYLSKLEEGGFSGSVLFAKGDEVLLNKGYGFSDKERKIANSSNTIFDIGSVTKQFTAAGILKLEMQGKLSVEDKVGKYFNNVPDDKKDITIHHLLTHSSGLLSGIGDDYDAITTDDFITKAFNLKLTFKPGDDYNYSNVGYSLLGMIIEKVSGKTYEEYLYSNLWKPAQMEQTGYTRPNFLSTDVAIGYNKKGNAQGKPNALPWDTDAPYWHLKANGGILSSAKDMYKWHQVLKTEKVLSKNAIEKYFKPYVKEGKAQSFYAYGWAIYKTSRGTTLAAHNGGNGIFFADFWRYLDDDMTIILLNNNSTPYSQIIASQIGALYILPDFQPQYPDNRMETEMDEEDVKMMVEKTIEVLNFNNQDKWKAFIQKNGSDNFINMAPMELHLKYFNKFHNKLKGGKLARLEINGEEIIAGVRTTNGMETLVVNLISNQNGQIKFDGMMVE
ncbi:serine hydrolase domain-containing protein [Winogradskyella haliclonae]|uniref:Beta-lactamase-related domain-containing protein n=1 Tax=Winogradskyella haliclonae TaxID=2048558 RepID=A0ABQ2BWT6_9FLAO|nr:serine hydrolase domain-containing protein [Winogradskyella haliclonae]GGI56959.1 hypothetical protein GCM10011444_12680 [Winogradskyella haliclonae]